mmetsp:Transcript_31697/g.82817  ORF Transcript_31697/g.82817 Transcript_31697/m.82817 type:complete len:81 (+) Transcript_31697:194-436(+)
MQSDDQMTRPVAANAAHTQNSTPLLPTCLIAVPVIAATQSSAPIAPLNLEELDDFLCLTIMCQLSFPLDVLVRNFLQHSS